MSIGELLYKPDAPRALARIEAFWNRAVLDRPCVQVYAPRPGGLPMPRKSHPTVRDRWMDAEHTVAMHEAWISSTYYGGDLLPQFWANLGPEIMTASLGAELEFGEVTSWSVPMLHDWAEIPRLAVDPHNPYLRKILEMTQLGLEIGKGKFITGITDLHPGADLAASLRDPQQFCVDLAEAPDECMALMRQLRPSFYAFYNLQHDLLKAAGQTVTGSWLPLYTDGKCYIPSNDFSCMVSEAMHRKFFLWEIVEECEWLDHSIYHLDGPGALRHLDDLLAIGRLDAVQWVYGAGNEPASRWMDVYKRIQAAGKCMHISMEAWELDTFMEHLRPEGVCLNMGAASIEEADAIIKRVASWTH